MFRKCLGANTEKEDTKQLPLEKKIHDLQQENVSLQSVVEQMQQKISEHVKTVSILEGECADRLVLFGKGLCMLQICNCMG